MVDNLFSATITKQIKELRSFGHWAQRNEAVCQVDAKAINKHIDAIIDLLNGHSRKDEKLFYDEFVRLTPNEYERLAEKIGPKVRDELIEDLNNYIGSKGKRYKSHYHTLLQWAKKNGGQKSAVRKALENWDAKE